MPSLGSSEIVPGSPSGDGRAATAMKEGRFPCTKNWGGGDAADLTEDAPAGENLELDPDFGALDGPRRDGPKRSTAI